MSARKRTYTETILIRCKPGTKKKMLACGKHYSLPIKRKGEWVDASSVSEVGRYCIEKIVG